jgi:hypothetical protein
LNQTIRSPAGRRASASRNCSISVRTSGEA